ncbi:MULTISPECIES: preprotein translocase subunit SecY [Anaerococcus]|uniref:Protein translocase subunit SecY n=1 Tax=Anaerococcus nagyae TaxID=1755241 RepID=A0A3E2TL54_9FIRM|nr:MULTISPECIES: preprotein translocase subunit SecY [Anaerococcus]MBP2069096.1 preprotein translocase subunit SecY [Anaerococcus nagyae]MDU1828146.1 preprotein translocase subunit SecY [Anaerococcus sp.]MDU1864351.1 preprotein translocase subunit SecY [Anaerococcus sp.]MDU2354093.1 preprotein translocase subunit SecY [Anaerococcus sp.]MDU2565241.1 preprotein translocase subunit SecY [Anaerococcus sp.]
MLETIKKASREPEIRERFWFTMLMLLVYRFGNNIPLPFIDQEALKSAYSSVEGTLVDYLNMLTGGGLSTLSIFALGVQPYITSSIVMQLLTVVIPRLEELTREGEQGRKQIQKYTRYVTIVLAIFQAIAVTNGLYGAALSNATTFQKIAMNVILIGGTMFVTWMGETITEKGLGNGTSLLIFMGIIASFPKTLSRWTSQVHYGLVGYLPIIIMAILVILIVIAVVLISEGERRIPIQYAKRVVGRKMYGGQSTHIPVKVNMGGVMPIVFASAVLAIPSTISLFFGNGGQSGITNFFQNTTGGFILYLIIQSALILIFAYFYNQIQFNTVEYAKQLQQNGGFIPGIRPGKPTSEYLAKVATRITFIGSIALALLTIIPAIASKLLGLRLSFGGSSVIIVVGVIIETIKQLEAMMTMKQYKGFLNR